MPLAEKYKTLSFSPKNLLISHASKQSNALILKSIQQDTLIRIVGTLVESAELPPYCGLIIFKGTYKFKIENVLSGIYLNTYILVQFQCPREMGVNYFQIGKKYNMKVRKIKNKGFSIKKKRLQPSDNIPLYEYYGTL